MDLGEPNPQLNLDEIQKLDPNNRTDYLALRRMYESEGWRLFMQWLGIQAQELLTRQLTAPQWDQVLLARGSKGMCDLVARIEGLTDATYRQIVEDSTTLIETDDVFA